MVLGGCGYTLFGKLLCANFFPVTHNLHLSGNRTCSVWDSVFGLFPFLLELFVVANGPCSMGRLHNPLKSSRLTQELLFFISH